MDDVTPVLGAVQHSGFPLQARIQHEIQRRPAWSVLASEHPWIDPDGREQFVDLIACCSGRRAVVLVIECKKMQQRSLLFLPRLMREFANGRPISLGASTRSGCRRTKGS